MKRVFADNIESLDCAWLILDLLKSGQLQS